MSFCPSKDLHSVYLDGELPEHFVKEYEEHVAGCAECQKQLEQLRKLRNIFESDSKAITPDSHYLNQSYERLLVKMKYSKTTSKHKKFVAPNFVTTKQFSIISSAVAAAAVFAMIIPVGFSVMKRVSPRTAAVAAALVSSNLNTFNTKNSLDEINSGRSVVISGNIDESFLTNVSSSGQSGNIARNISMNNKPGYIMSDVDVFRPDFNEGRTITIKVTVPGMNSMSAPTQVKVPVSVF